MNYKLQTRRAFTLIELVVAVALLAMVLSFASVIFKVGIGAYRTAGANAEIMQKLRAITDQLNADFKGLRKDGEIFVVWMAVPVAYLVDADDYDDDPDGYLRFDRIMFFANGDFQSYHQWLVKDSSGPKILHGNVARICYMLANVDETKAPQEQYRQKRILARTQHILTAADILEDDGITLSTFPHPGLFDRTLNNWYEYDKTSLEGWKNIPSEQKMSMLTAITDVYVEGSIFTEGGAIVDITEPNSFHMLLCEGVGEFKVQGWYDTEQRWVPEVDPNGNGFLTDDTDFFLVGEELDPDRVPGVLYPYPPYGRVGLGGVFEGKLFQELLNEAHFNAIPGLGRALKFTFTLYESKRILEDGPTFTHIVYLD